LFAENPGLGSVWTSSSAYCAVSECAASHGVSRRSTSFELVAYPFQFCAESTMPVTTMSPIQLGNVLGGMLTFYRRTVDLMFPISSAYSGIMVFCVAPFEFVAAKRGDRETKDVVPKQGVRVESRRCRAIRVFSPYVVRPTHPQRGWNSNKRLVG
jgi:hypothetical protein